jgi:hypothetical protein
MEAGSPCVVRADLQVQAARAADQAVHLLVTVAMVTAIAVAMAIGGEIAIVAGIAVDPTGADTVIAAVPAGGRVAQKDIASAGEILRRTMAAAVAAEAGRRLAAAMRRHQKTVTG